MKKKYITPNMYSVILPSSLCQIAGGSQGTEGEDADSKRYNGGLLWEDDEEK